MSAARPRLVVIGAGVMGSYHTRVIAQSERAELAAVVDPDVNVGKAVAARFGAEWYPDFEAVDNVDAVVVAAPTETHAQVVRNLLDAGLPMLVEKPFSDDLATAEALIAEAAQRQIPMMCGFVERFNPAILTLRQIVQEPVHVAAVRHSPYAGRIRTGVSWDLLIHDVDACLRLVGAEPTTVRAGLGQFHPSSVEGGEDIADAVMVFGSGAVASASASRIGHRKIRTLAVTELNRVIELDLLRRDVTVYRHVSADLSEQGPLGYRQQTIIEIPELVSAREPLAAQLDHFLDLLAGKVDLAVERDSILPAHRVIDQVVSAARPA
jgi:predicted dehydrogenase